MSKQKDELISGSELARRLKVDPSYINNKTRKAKLKDAKCMFGKKFYYIKSCEYLGKDPNDPHKSRQSNLQTDIKRPKANATIRKKIGLTKKQEQKIISQINDGLDDIEPPKKPPLPPSDNNDTQDEAKSLLDLILEAVKKNDSSINRKDLDLLRQKAGVLREYFTAKNEEIKNRKLENNLFEKDEVIQILSFAMNMIRNALINLPNNYAVNLEGMEQKEIKEYVTDDTNKILEDLQNIGNQFE